MNLIFGCGCVQLDEHCSYVGKKAKKVQMFYAYPKYRTFSKAHARPVTLELLLNNEQKAKVLFVTPR